MNKIKLAETCEHFIHSKKFFYHVTLANVSKILNNSVYFQDIVVHNDPL